MPSMSYCKFENTVLEMRQCLEAVENADSLDNLDLSQYEQESLPRLYSLCKKFAKEFERIHPVK
jgi:hypothetical protein